MNQTQVDLHDAAMQFIRLVEWMDRSHLSRGVQNQLQVALDSANAIALRLTQEWNGEPE